MLYCPGKGQELLSALGVNLECHASSIFLVLKPPNVRCIIKVYCVTIGPDVIGNSWAFCCGFHISEVFFLSCVEGPASLTNITPWTVTTRNFINNICLRFQRWSKFWGRELLLKGDEWFVYHCDVVFFEDTSQRFCYAFNVWKRGERLAWFGPLDHLEKCSNKFLQGQHCWASAAPLSFHENHIVPKAKRKGEIRRTQQHWGMNIRFTLDKTYHPHFSCEILATQWKALTDD